MPSQDLFTSYWYVLTERVEWDRLADRYQSSGYWHDQAEAERVMGEMLRSGRYVQAQLYRSYIPRPPRDIAWELAH